MHPSVGSAPGSLGAIVGPGRSGTTWAGTLVDSCPDVIYRFEPFRRMAVIDMEIRTWLNRLKRQDISDSELARIYSSLLAAHPLTNKPPFFHKSYRMTTLCRAPLWPAARALSAVGRLYGAVYSPAPGPPLIFKEVTFLKPTQTLVGRTSMPVVYIARHPCATVLSEVEGQVQAKMPSGRLQRLPSILAENAPHLAERFSDVLVDPDPVPRAALLWRFEVDFSISHVLKSARGLVMTYEQLISDTHDRTRQLLAHFGLNYTIQTERFIDFLLGLRSSGKMAPRRTGWGAKYFTVYRNPREQKDAWKSRISSDARGKINSIVKDSPAYMYCAALGNWD